MITSSNCPSTRMPSLPSLIFCLPITWTQWVPLTQNPLLISWILFVTEFPHLVFFFTFTSKSLTHSFIDPEVVRCSVRILNNVASYIYFNQYKNTVTIQNIQRILVAQQNFWDVVMNSLLNAFIFGTSNCLWDITRPIFSIYLVKKQALDQCIQNMASNQLPMNAARLMEDTNTLLNHIDLSLSERSRDEFSKKAILWRKQFLSYMQL